MHTDPHEPHQHPAQPVDPESPGYETTDVNVGGVIVFLAAMAGFLAVFFVFCFGMGKVINQAIEKQDGPSNVWHQTSVVENSGLGNMAPNPEMQQKELQQMVTTFPSPRLQTDDGNQEVADMHAREDLLLNHYSYVDKSAGTIRIPIERAMALLVQRGLPVAPTVQTADEQMAGDTRQTVQVPLTDGFARTGYEQEEMQTREQRLKLMRPEPETHAQLIRAK